jgi:3-oxoacyl-[acyl-carrier-protein] synthase II
MDEIVITGMGMVTPIGASRDAFWAANLAGTSGLVRESRMDLSSLPCGWVAGLIPEPTREAVQERWRDGGHTWGDMMLHDAVDQALTDARVNEPLERPAGLCWSRVWPGPSGPFPADYVTHIQEMADRFEEVGNRPAATLAHLRRQDLTAKQSDISDFPTLMSKRLGTPLVNTRLESTCAGGLRAVAEATRMLELGLIDMAVIAVSVSRFTPYVLSQYAQLMALSRWKGDPAQASMPFDRRRNGMVLNESAGALVLETAAHAARRGVPDAYAVVSGWGLAVDTSHVTAPRVDVVERVMRGALSHADVHPEGIDAVNAHGTSTKLNDVTEARAMHRVFGERMADLDVSAVKSLTGHGSAASGVVESAVAALTLSQGVVPPVVTCTEPDPACGVKTSLTPVCKRVDRVLKNSFGFGGQYASMVFSRAATSRQVPTPVGTR